MTSFASSSAPPTVTPPSVFISYASADRDAARRLHDYLTAAHLEVWLDDEELAGGEAWDAKIRHQIRTCTYFMPIISATTEARGEGYFRREWRLAVERMLDLADDVLFLVPVVIDDTREQGARVPDKFGSVQWLRCPGGHETRALAALARRLVNTSQPSPALPTPLSTVRLPHTTPDAHATAPAAPDVSFRPFPAYPASGQRLRFIYELIIWAGHTSYVLWMRLPRWLRLAAMTIFVIKLIDLISSPSRP